MIITVTTVTQSLVIVPLAVRRPIQLDHIHPRSRAGLLLIRPSCYLKFLITLGRTMGNYK